jgi:hypothetical protein
MVEKNVLTLTEAVKAMNKLIQTNPRLPLDECRKRLHEWAVQSAG